MHVLCVCVTGRQGHRHHHPCRSRAHAGHSPSSRGGRRSIAHKWLGSARSQRTTQTKVRVQRKAQKIATSAAVDAAVAAGRAAAGALTPVTPAATQLPPSYGVITPAAAAAWGAQMAAQAQAAAAQTAAATPTQTL